MFLMGFLIAVIVLFNFFIKKNLYYSILIGNILLFLLFVIKFNIPVNIFFYKENLMLYIKGLFIFAFIVVLKNINYSLKNTDTKDQITELANYILKDKNIKILFLILMSFLLMQTPLIGLIVLIFIASFLNASKIGMIVIPLTYTGLTQIVLIYTDETKNIEKTNKIIIFLIIIYYLFMYIFYLIENNKQFRKNFLKRNIIDFLFTIILLIVNLFFFFSIGIITTYLNAVIISLIMTLFFARYLVSKIHVFHNQDLDLNESVDVHKISKLSKTNIPYLLILLLFIVQLLIYSMMLKYLYAGMIVFIIVNTLIMKKISSKEKEKFKFDKYKKFLIIYSITLLNYIMIMNLTSIDNSSLFGTFYTNITESNNLMQNVLLNIQSFIFFPITTFINSVQIDLSSSAVEYNSVNLLKFQIIVYIQMLFSILTYYYISFIFSVDEEDDFNIVTIITIISMIFQILIYLIN